jgi:hypothetical protein
MGTIDEEEIKEEKEIISCYMKQVRAYYAKMRKPITYAQQPLSGSDGVPSSPKSAKPTSDNCERCVKSQN